MIVEAQSGASDGSDYAGGDLQIRAGRGGTTNGAGGNTEIRGGRPRGSGTPGKVNITAYIDGITDERGVASFSINETPTPDRSQILVGSTSYGFDGEIVAPDGYSAAGLNLYITAGGGDTNQDGGDVVISSGAGDNSVDGYVIIQDNATPIAYFGQGSGVIFEDDTYINGKLTVTGLIDPTGLVLDEQASSPATSVSGKGQVWVSSSDGYLMFTDENDTDYNLITGSVGPSGDVTGPSSSVDDEIVRFSGTDGKTIQAGTGVTLTDDGYIQNVSQINLGSTDPDDGYGVVTFSGEFDDGYQSSAFSINWNQGQKHTVEIDGSSLSVTFVDPPGVCNLVLRIVQANGGDTVSWPASAKWPGGTAPTLSTGDAAEDIISFYYNGTDYYGVATLNFS
jgi:hypothetical protein